MLVQTYCVKCTSLGCFLRMRKTQPVRKFSILLHKRMRFTQVWTNLKKHQKYVTLFYESMQIGMC